MCQLKKNGGKQVSVFIPRVLVGRIVDLLKSMPSFEEIPVTNKYEALRGRIGDKTVIIYISGSILYDETLEEFRRMLEEVLYEKYKDQGIVVGSDEAGKGEALGPIVVAATALSPKQAAYLQSIGVADSKIVPKKKIGELASEIKRVSLGYSILMISPKRFNDMFRKGGENLNDILERGQSQVLKRVVSKIREKPYRIIVDKFDSSKSGVRMKKISELLGFKVEAIERGEVFPAVAAASILARNSYLRWIHRNVSKELFKEIIRKNYDAVGKEEVPYLFKIRYLEKVRKT